MQQRHEKCLQDLQEQGKEGIKKLHEEEKKVLPKVGEKKTTRVEQKVEKK